MLLPLVPAPPVFQPPPKNPRFPLFDSLRGMAALGVFVVHATLITNADGSWWGRYIVSLDSVLAIFFVISAFLLYRPFAAARIDRTNQAPRLVDYARNRFLRIVPAYWVALTVLAFVPGNLGGFWHDYTPVYYLFLQEFDFFWSRGGIIPAWSITVEVCFYTFLPVFVIVMRDLVRSDSRRTRIATEVVALGVLFCVAFVYRLWLRQRIGDDPTSNLWAVLPASIDWLALGMLLAVVSVALAGRRPAPVRLIERAPGLCWLVTAALLIGAALLRPAGEFPTPVGSLEWVFIHQAYGFAALALCLPAAIGGSKGGLVRGLLARPWLSWFGMISYSFFLYHHPITYAVAEWDPGRLWEEYRTAAVMIVSFVITLGAGTASYYLIERPALKLKRTRLNPGRARAPEVRSPELASRKA